MIKMRNYRIERMFLLMASLLFMIGCMPEKQLGTAFLAKRKDITMVIMAPQWVKMVNMSYDSAKYGFWPTQRGMDSLKFYYSKILQDLTDSIIISNYVLNLQHNLEDQGYKTLIASRNDTVFPVKAEAFLINIGQIEIDESKLPIRDETRFNNKLYGADYDLAKIEMFFWLEVSKIENGKAVLPPRLLYDSDDITDGDVGHFQWDDQAKRMNYSIEEKEILPEDVYKLASAKGADHGLRLNDFFMNEYISFFLPQKTDRLLLGVDPQYYGNLIRIDSQPFTEIHE